MKIPAEGGEPVFIPTQFFTRPAPSPDGKTIAALNSQWRLAFVDAATGKTLKETSLSDIDGLLHWTPDGRSLAFMRTTNGAANLWLYDVKNGAIRQLTHFETGDLGGYDWGPGGRSIVCARVNESRRVVLIRGFR